MRFVENEQDEITAHIMPGSTPAVADTKGCNNRHENSLVEVIISRYETINGISLK
ncbi:MAG TPA: hypothetical protein VMT57_03895 [Candidatus Thermoplasmatota archaeon]|nr:hypothetical protein [Candidatus Thermoplasmatota archaeon]